MIGTHLDLPVGTTPEQQAQFDTIYRAYRVYDQLLRHAIAQYGAGNILKLPLASIPASAAGNVGYFIDVDEENVWVRVAEQPQLEEI